LRGNSLLKPEKERITMLNLESKIKPQDRAISLECLLLCLASVDEDSRANIVDLRVAVGVAADLASEIVLALDGV
jgi:hypothetical protein